MLNAVNAERAAQGLAPFCYSAKLQAAVQLHSEDQASHSFMSHTGSNHSTMVARIEVQRSSWLLLAKKVAGGQANVTSVVRSCMNSSDHRANILGKYTLFGMGYAYDATSYYGYYWTQNFGSSWSEVCD